jgi:hypothetical protein
MYYTCMFGMVGMMVCMEKIMAVFMQVGKGTVFSAFAIFLPMIVGMKIVIMLPIGILIMVVTVAMGISLFILMIVSMGIMVVGPVLFLTMVVVVIIDR